MNVRVEKSSNFTTIDNGIFQDRRLSNSARGLLVLMLSLPDDWDYSINGLIAICKEGRCAVRNSLKELKDLGYLKINKILPNKTNSNVFEYEYVIYEKAQDTGIQGVENQGVDYQGVENRPLDSDPLNNNNKPPLSNKILNNKELINKKEIYKENNYSSDLDCLSGIPTLQEIKDFITLKEFDIDPEYFYNYYSAMGWKKNGYPIENWQALLTQWGRKSNMQNGLKDIAKKEQEAIKPKRIEPEFEMRKYTQQEMDDIFSNSNITDDDI